MAAPRDTARMDFREGYAPGNGLRLHYVEWGPATAPAVLLLHGIGGHGLVWQPVVRVLGRRFRCIAPDARGHGASGWAGAGGYVSDEHFADLPPLLDALGVERAAVCGHSMGAAAAIQFAACLPERCWGLVVVDAYPDPAPSAGSEQIARFCADLPERFASREAALGAAGAVVGRDGANGRAFDLALQALEDGAYTWRQDPAIREELREWLRDGEPLRRIDLWPFWRAIQSPALLFRGSSSAVLTAEMARRMVDELAHARLVEMRGGHALLDERPQELAEAITAFLDAVEVGTQPDVR